ncbi:MAG TPA: VOC family protein [Vicinamibacterales bacterium]|nr:VOC family protein [Vicinamibacterales bacterium]
MAVKAIPDGYYSLTPYLVCKGAAKAIEFYTKAFGAVETVRMPGPNGQVMHAEVKIGNSMLMLSDENKERGALSPETIGGTCVSVMLYTDDVDTVFNRAVTLGAKTEMPPADMFWGDRMGNLVDPFGHKWAIATHKEDVTPDEMQKRMAAIGS